MICDPAMLLSLKTRCRAFPALIVTRTIVVENGRYRCPSPNGIGCREIRLPGGRRPEFLPHRTKKIVPQVRAQPQEPDTNYISLSKPDDKLSSARFPVICRACRLTVAEREDVVSMRFGIESDARDR